MSQPVTTATAARIAVLTLLTLLAPLGLEAQDAEVPRTRTSPGIDAPAFPYAQPEEVGLSSETLDRLGDEIASWAANGDFVGGELLIVKDGRAVFHEAYGWSDREERIPVERNSIWSIKSMSKPFTAAAVLMLAEEGKLSLDDPVSRYIPGFAGDEQTTIRHLLSHTSGYRDEDLGDPSPAHESFGQWVEEWASVAPTGTFGEYEYTDFGFAAAGYIVEEVTGVPIGVFTEKRIVGPLRLGDTSTEFSEDPAWRARLNPWYRWNEDAASYDLRWSAGRPPWQFYPAAWGMFSTAMDYAEFMAMWMNEGEWRGVRLLSEETVGEALEPHATSGGYGVYGYGWFVNDDEGEGGLPLIFFHGGGDGTIALAFPAANAMAIFLTHSRWGSHLGALQNRLSMLGVFQYPGGSMEWAHEHDLVEVELSQQERAVYVGTYLNTEQTGRSRGPRVWEEDGRLHVRLGPFGARADFRFHLVPLGEHHFALGRYVEGKLEAVDPESRFRFVVEEGRAGAVEFLEGDRVVFSAQRTDPERLLGALNARPNRTRISDIIFETLEAEGAEAARAQHRALRASAPDSIRFDGSLLNVLGYRLLYGDRTEEAIAVFEMNVEAYPEAPNPYDSLGDAFRAAGRLEDARRSYARAVELAEEQGHENLAGYRSRLESVTQQLDGEQ